ncbi:hypothetical protein [Sphingomonas sp. CFBP 8760]|uniref:hypothetical protein n=1 Tax=Sphingomonas sp. CFBP 8760 TaxID=2775282 RepID=UPI001785429D|nr:hypothetical protein [Sphingomonas sp. CFBP 8760]MBD8547989.1 hypothetical protein [Sphingomonas sp. CFBP 8760]
MGEDSPATRFTLANGLRVVVQPDRRVPIVSVVRQRSDAPYGRDQATCVPLA